MKIFFARHGESQANLQHIITNRGLNHGLTPMGREQATTLAVKLQDYSIKQIYTSPLQRAIETSAIVAQSLHLEYKVVDALREYDCGILEGRSDENAWQRWQELFDAWVLFQQYGQCIQGGESFEDVRCRFVPFIEALIKCYVGTPDGVLCISHGGILSVMFPWILHNVSYAMVKSYGFPYTRCVVAEHNKEGLVCVEWNGMPVDPDLTGNP